MLLCMLRGNGNGAEIATKTARKSTSDLRGLMGPGSTEIDAFHGYIDELRFSDEVLGPNKLGFSGTLLDVYPAGKLTTKWATLKKK